MPEPTASPRDVPNKPYDHRTDPNKAFRISIDDKRGRPTHAVYEFLTCTVCGTNYRPGMYKRHKGTPAHVAKMTGHRAVKVNKPVPRRCSG